MTVMAMRKDPQTHTMTTEAEFDASPERVWQLWADPRQLERWWGPPTYPVTVVDHDLVPGGRVTYFMTGPDGALPHNQWEVLAVDPPKRLEVKDAITDEDGTPADGGPALMVVTLTERAGVAPSWRPSFSSRRSKRWSRRLRWTWTKASPPPRARSRGSSPTAELQISRLAENGSVPVARLTPSGVCEFRYAISCPTSPTPLLAGIGAIATVDRMPIA